TTMAIVASLLSPTAGSVQVAGADPARDPAAVRRAMGYMPDVVGVYDNLRVGEYLEFFAAAHRLPPSTWPRLVGGLLELVDLAAKRDAMVDSLSRGMKQRLSLARALVHDPEVLVLDEPASGLDPRARVELRNLLGELRSMGKTILISSHILAELDEMCTHVAIIEAGRLVASGSPAELQSQVASARSVRVVLAGGEERQYPVGDEADQQALLRRLVVDEGLAVVEFTATGDGLEALFLKLTKGVVQ
ncbi:MAG: ABC transporter ATP-binding protein, partial [Acidimicrobiales bacterium]